LTRRGQTIDFLLTAKRDAAAAKRFFRKAVAGLNNPQPRVINVDPAYVPAVTELKSEGYFASAVVYASAST
jgi:IS6 family transposase